MMWRNVFRFRRERVALLIDGDQAMQAMLRPLLTYFLQTQRVQVPIRNSYFKCRSIRYSPKWTAAIAENDLEGIVVKQYGSKNKELVDKKLSIDAVRYALQEHYSVAIVSRDKGFAQVFELLAEAKAPPFYAVSSAENYKLFAETGASFINDRFPDDYFGEITKRQIADKKIRALNHRIRGLQNSRSSSSPLVLVGADQHAAANKRDMIDHVDIAEKTLTQPCFTDKSSYSFSDQLNRTGPVEVRASKSKVGLHEVEQEQVVRSSIETSKISPLLNNLHTKVPGFRLHNHQDLREISNTVARAERTPSSFWSMPFVELNYSPLHQHLVDRSSPASTDVEDGMPRRKNFAADDGTQPQVSKDDRESGKQEAFKTPVRHERSSNNILKRAKCLSLPGPSPNMNKLRMNRKTSK